METEMSYEYEIDKDIPLPPKHFYRYPWYALEVGESFLVERPTEEIRALWGCLSSCRCNAQRKTGRKFALRRNSKGIRVWRVK